MIVVCTNCALRLQLNDAKIPSRPFTVRCPKCQSIVEAQPPATDDQSALALGDSPATENPRLEPPAPAPAFKLESSSSSSSSAPSEEVRAYAETPALDSSDLIRLLAAALQRGQAAGEKHREATRLSWEKRRVLICATPTHREAVARLLAENDYQVFVAEDTRQAMERMREDRMDIVILDTEFDPIEQGAAYVTREVTNLRPAERRRLFFVHLSSTARTLDQHAAFINNVNIIVNTADLERLPRTLERSIRDYNELYRNFNNSLNVAAL
jgi:predicted Zn finger-like uncharacterized protein